MSHGDVFVYLTVTYLLLVSHWRLQTNRKFARNSTTKSRLENESLNQIIYELPHIMRNHFPRRIVFRQKPSSKRDDLRRKSVFQHTSIFNSFTDLSTIWTLNDNLLKNLVSIVLIGYNSTFTATLPKAMLREFSCFFPSITMMALNMLFSMALRNLFAIITFLFPEKLRHEKFNHPLTNYFCFFLLFPRKRSIGNCDTVIQNTPEFHIKLHNGSPLREYTNKNLQM